VQTQGLLQESSLASLLQTMQTERATGALALESQNETASLFFLFGHLFHAAGPTGQGEDVVLDALSWQDGSFHFDPRAKLPPEETIKASPSELIAEAERRGPAPPHAAAADHAAWTPAAGYEDPGAYTAPIYEESVAGYGDNGWAAPEEPDLLGSDQQAAGYAPWNPPAPGPAAPAPIYQAPPRYQPVEQRPAPAPEPAPYRPEPPPAPAPIPAPMSAPAPIPAPVAVLGAPAAAPLDILYPLPAGRPQYEGLKSAFVDFPKLLRTLRGDQHTGYVRLLAPDFSGVLLYHQGHLLDARSTSAAARIGEAAFQAMRRSMDAGTGSLDVIDLAGETVEAIAQLLTSPLIYTGLLGRFVNFDALLAYLTEEGVEGAVLVVGSEDIGVILLSRGRVLGAYTQNNSTLSTSTTAVAKIAAEKTARIEVKSGAGALSAIDVESALSRAY
jgi:hypothetical protein